ANGRERRLLHRRPDSSLSDDEGTAGSRARASGGPPQPLRGRCNRARRLTRSGTNPRGRGSHRAAGEVMTDALDTIGRSLSDGAGMFWETLWALVLGFGLSGAVQAFVSRADMQRALGDHRPRTIARAGVF